MDSINIGNRKIYKAFRAFLWYWTHASTWRTANRTHCYFNRGILLLPLVLDTCLNMKDSEQKAYLRWYCYPGFPLLPLVLDTRFDIKDSEQNTDLSWYCMCLHQRLHCTDEVQKGRNSVRHRCLQFDNSIRPDLIAFLNLPNASCLCAAST